MLTPELTETRRPIQSLTRNVHAGGGADLTISREAAAYIATIGGPEIQSLETGAGLSTVLLAQQGGKHICITPSADEIERIKAECSARNISTERVEFICLPSEMALPGRDLPPLDVVLIDGGHGFPVPLIDYYFSAGALKIGGLLLVDDVHIWACAILVKVLREDPAWEQVTNVGHRTVVFRKVGEFRYQEFCDQPYVVRHTRWPKFVTAVRRSLDLVVQGEFGVLMQRIRKKLRG